MSTNPWKRMDVDGVPVKVLKVPLFQQGEDEVRRTSDNYCVPYSVKMLLEFMVDGHTDDRLRLHNRAWKVDEIISKLPFHPVEGCDVHMKFLDDLNKELKFFSLAPRGLDSLDVVEREFKLARPCLVIYNHSLLLTGRRRGMAHASVLVGINDSSVVLNDPWYAWPQAYSRDDFEEAWLAEHLNTVLVEIHATEKTTLREFFAPEQLDAEPPVERVRREVGTA